MMKKVFYSLLLCSLLLPLSLLAQKPKLNFKEGKFKLMQLSDTHWTEGTEHCPKTRQTIEAIVRLEHPQLVVITGDVVTGQPAREGWQSIIKIFDDLKQPFVVAMGNHDPEFLSRDEMYKLLVQSPYYVGERGPRDITGAGNCVIPVYGSKQKNKAEALIYCFDSNDYQPQDGYGFFDWIHHDQIDWYRKESAKYTKENGGKALPALACFHIPLPEYAEVVKQNDYLGNLKDEGIGSPTVNSGLFNAFLDCKDVMAVLAGHDHNNDFIGLCYDIALAYGRLTGSEAYGSMERGCRIVELYEGERRFDSWVRTPSMKEDTYYYPSGLTSKDAKALPLLPKTVLAKGTKLKQGVNYIYLEGNFEKTADLKPRKGLSKFGIMPNFSIKGAKVKDHFGYIYTSLIKIPKTAVYRFYVYSDDGAVLYLDGQKVVDNDGGHSPRRKEGKVYLEEGYHALKLLYFDDYIGEALKVGLSSRFLDECEIPNDWLFYEVLVTR